MRRGRSEENGSGKHLFLLELKQDTAGIGDTSFKLFLYVYLLSVISEFRDRWECKLWRLEKF